MNRCQNTIQEPMEIPQAPGSLASAIRRAVWSAWLLAPRPGRSFGPGGRERRIPGSGLQVALKIETEVPAVTGA
jgi:hypothetical protein